MLPRELALSLGFREIGKVDNVSFFASGQSGLEEEFHWIQPLAQTTIGAA